MTKITHHIKNVFVPVFCGNLHNESGALLFINTIRVGFPTANITVYWNGELDIVKDKLKFRCEELGITFKVSSERFNGELIERLFFDTSLDSFTVVDSDMIFYADCEDVEFEDKTFVAGCKIPSFKESLMNCLSIERLHPSFLVFRELPLLRDELKARRPLELNFIPFSLFAPVTIVANKQNMFFDTCATMTQFFDHTIFGMDMLNRYTHIFCGSYFTEAIEKDPTRFSYFIALFETAMKNPLALRYLWVRQFLAFKKLTV